MKNYSLKNLTKKFIISICFLQTVFADLSYELVEAKSDMPQITFSTSGSNHSITEGLNNTILDDFTKSGEFIVNRDSIIPSIDSLTNLHNKGVKYFVTITHDAKLSSKNQLTIQVFSLDTSKNIDFVSPIAVKKFQFDDVDYEDFAHVASDFIYKLIQGYPSNFTSKIAYVSKKTRPGMESVYQLEVADYNGKNSAVILQTKTPIISPKWSPDSKKIAYVSYESNKAEIYIQDVLTGNRSLFSAEEGANSSPSWSYDGKDIALVLTKSGISKIYTKSLFFKKLQNITAANNSDLDDSLENISSTASYSKSSIDGYAIDTEPFWSNNNSEIFFTSNRGHSPQVYRYSFIDKSIDRISFRGDYNASPQITSDNKNLIMLHRERGLFSIAKQDLYDGKLYIISSDGYEESPAISANNKIVAYATKYAARGIIGIVSLDGIIKWRLLSLYGDIQDPSWSGIDENIDKYEIANNSFKGVYQ